MITDIPTADDFKTNGLAFLNLAWDSIARVAEVHDSLQEDYDPEYTTDEEKEQAEEAYWRNSQPALATAVALSHQGGEFLLKARIASVSPFLLLYVDKWPGNIDGVNKSFADFRTVDAQELVKIHDNVYESQLPARFKTNFENLRKLRNTIMHSVHRQQPFTPREGVLAILDIVDTLVGEKSWQAERLKFQEQRGNSWDPFGNSQFNPLHGYADETMQIITNLLQPAEALKYYGFDKRKRAYNCVNCYEPNADNLIMSVQLQPGAPDSETVYCVCCQKASPVRRQDCEKCEGNVFGMDSYDESWICLTCNNSYLDLDESDE